MKTPFQTRQKPLFIQNSCLNFWNIFFFEHKIVLLGEYHNIKLIEKVFQNLQTKYGYKMKAKTIKILINEN